MLLYIITWEIILRYRYLITVLNADDNIFWVGIFCDVLVQEELLVAMAMLVTMGMGWFFVHHHSVTLKHGWRNVACIGAGIGIQSIGAWGPGLFPPPRFLKTCRRATTDILKNNWLLNGPLKLVTLLSMKKSDAYKT